MWTKGRRSWPSRQPDGDLHEDCPPYPNLRLFRPSSRHSGLGHLRVSPSFLQHPPSPLRYWLSAPWSSSSCSSSAPPLLSTSSPPPTCPPPYRRRRRRYRRCLDLNLAPGQALTKPRCTRPPSTRYHGCAEHPFTFQHARARSHTQGVNSQLCHPLVRCLCVASCLLRYSHIYPLPRLPLHAAPFHCIGHLGCVSTSDHRKLPGRGLPTRRRRSSLHGLLHCVVVPHLVHCARNRHRRWERDCNLPSSVFLQRWSPWYTHPTPNTLALSSSTSPHLSFPPSLHLTPSSSALAMQSSSASCFHGASTALQPARPAAYQPSTSGRSCPVAASQINPPIAPK